MHIKAIELVGYKSFADSVRVALGPGITCFVGPNGAGKSNLAVDAVGFVCGERAWTRQRAEDGMRDLIFSGTDARAAADQAVVTVLFENADRRIPMDADEVEIRRVLPRDGAAKIQINGASMTLREARPYLMATGLGPESPQIVRQGTVQEIVEGGAEQIGRAIDYAAGIAYYLARREEAAMRLAQVREKLKILQARLTAAQEELKSARIRAGRARKRREMEEERAALEASLADLRRRRIQDEVDQVRRQHDELQSKLDALVPEMTRHQSEIQALEELVAGDSPPSGLINPESAPALRHVATDLARAADRLDSYGASALPAVSHAARESIEKLEALFQTDAPRPADHLTRLRKARAESESAQKRQQDLSKQIAAAEGKLDVLTEQLAAFPQPSGRPVVGDAADLEARLVQIDRQLAAFGRVDETAEDDVVRLEAEIGRLRGPAGRDLEDAAQRIEAIVDRMDEAMRVRRRQALLRVRERFGEFFESLFGGGRATIHWEDERPDESDTVSNNGQEEQGGEPEPTPGPSGPRAWIEVQLPGRPREPLMLLSGGQKSLCGLAFVVAVAQAAADEEGISGPPIIVDEADAALEEANSLRFVTLLRAMARHSQVLCITHNRRVMEAADILWGVTTGSDRTSRVLTVQLTGGGSSLPEAVNAIGSGEGGPST